MMRRLSVPIIYGTWLAASLRALWKVPDWGKSFATVGVLAGAFVVWEFWPPLAEFLAQGHGHHME
jgi:hypothetical protein